MINIPKHLLQYENKIQELIFKSIKKIDEYDISDFKFEEEYLLHLIKYVEEVFKKIVEGLSIEFQLKKSVKISIENLIKVSKGDEDLCLIYKSLFDKLSGKKRFKKDWMKKFNWNNGKPLDVLRFGKRIKYNPETKRPLTVGEWKKIEDDIVKFLKDKIGTIDEEMIVRGTLFGKLISSMEREGLTIDKIKNMSYSDLEDKYGDKLPQTKDELKIKKDEQKKAIDWSIASAANYVGMRLNSKLRSDIVTGAREVITEAMRDELTPEQLASELYWYEPGKKEGKKKYTNPNKWGLNFRRICFPAETKIMTVRGQTNIENINIGRWIITHIGVPKRVKKVMKRKYTGRMITIKTKSGLELTATELHEIYILRDNKFLWIDIKDLKIGDKVLKVEYKKKHFHDKKYKIKMSKIMKKNKVWKSKNCYDENGVRKCEISLRNKYKKGIITIWNKGLTKITDKRMMSISKSLKKGYKNGRETWNKGYTKETNKIVRIIANKLKNKIVSKETVFKWRETFTKNNSTNNKRNSIVKSIGGRILNKSNNKYEYYQSNYEKLFMEYCNKNKYEWTKNIGFSIKYFDDNNKERMYIPDFIVIKDNKKYIIEIKSFWQIKTNYKNTIKKIETAKKWCKENGYIYKILTESWLINQGLLA